MMRVLTQPLPLTRFAYRGLSSCSSNRALTRNVPIDVHPEVEHALAHSLPVVALETALVTHGLPNPTNWEVALSLEEIIRSAGSIPATIGIIEGRTKIGLERHELRRLAEKEGKPVKISRRDIAAATALGADGGTTCSATLVLAALAGIKVFATGGLGGVHQGGENSLDVSADLHELTRCPVGLVSSGVKSILDIKRTLEYLETLGVPVVTYGESKEFPAFFSRHSGHYVPWNAKDPRSAAKIIHAQQQLSMQNGVMIAVPIPEEYEAAGENIQKLVKQAVQESEANGVSTSGKDATPWLLSRIAKLSHGKSLISNVALLKNTALIGGQIAVEYHKVANEALYYTSKIAFQQPTPPKSDVQKTVESDEKPDVDHPSAQVVVIGSAAVDITAQELANSAIAKHSTAPGHVMISLGGVGRNVAEATHRVLRAKSSHLSVLLLAPIGGDSFGQILSKELNNSGMRVDGLLKFEDVHTAVCNMVLDSQGALVGGVADMGINSKFTADVIIPYLARQIPTIVTLDGNLSPETLKELIAYCNERCIQVLFEPTSTIKSTAILPAIAAALKGQYQRPPVTYCTPNLLELNELYDAARSEQCGLMNHAIWWSVVDSFNLGSAFKMDLEQLSRWQASGDLSFLQGFAQKAIHLLPFFQHLIVKCGDQGALVVMYVSPAVANSGWRQERSNPQQGYVVATGKSGEIVVIRHFPALPIRSPFNVTGAGDSFVGGLLASLANEPTGLYHPRSLSEVLSTAQRAAVLTLQSPLAVSPLLSKLVSS